MLKLKAEAELARVKEQPPEDVPKESKDPSADKDASKNAAAAKPKPVDPEKIKAGYQKAIELAPKAAGQMELAAKALKKKDRKGAYPPAEEARKILEEIQKAQPPKEDQKQDHKDQDKKKDEQQKQDQKDKKNEQQKQDQKDQDKKKDDREDQEKKKDEEKKKQDEQGKSEQEKKPQQKQEFSKDQIEEALRKVRERQQEKRERDRMLKARSGESTRGEGLVKRRAILAHALVGLALFLLISRAQADDEPEIAVEVGANEVFIGESFDYFVEVRNAKSPAAPDLSALRASFDVVAAGDESRNRSSMSIIDGRITQESTVSHIYRYRLTPKRGGKIVIPAPSATVDGQTISGARSRFR